MVRRLVAEREAEEQSRSIRGLRRPKTFGRPGYRVQVLEWLETGPEPVPSQAASPRWDGAANSGLF